MAVNNSIRAIFLCVSSMALLAGCSHSVSSGGVPEEGLTMSDIYHRSIADSAQSWTVPAYRGRRQVNYEGYVREAHNETQAKFKTLDNPAIPIFVYPHVAQLGDEQLVKPGFSSEFFLYKNNQFALANERY
ncbi:TIGR03751 family conjugal transfer lipoprotein [Legionella fairfieldensis]|uniref:TIGR03751 family conjugal transfer lipoprotein n=1 Tax=Legionella fairfieldensis TaxID=45064 RepID=UPI00048FCBED|nr:TIGR03751 family conjugal transfer lipoprotein [Legionella fairfieldensis]